MINPEKKFLLNLALTWGCGCGAALLLVMFSTSYVATGTSGVNNAGILQYMVLSLGIYFSIYSVIKKIGIKESTFKTLFVVGLLCGISASLFVDLYTVIYAKIINPGVVDQTIEESMKILKTSKIYDEQQLAMAQESARMMFVPMQLIINTILYATLSAICSALSTYMIRMRFPKNQ